MNICKERLCGQQKIRASFTFEYCENEIARNKNQSSKGLAFVHSRWRIN
jgi:hypothetical protein